MTPLRPTQELPQGITLVEANAGTGKTYTIASLFLRLLVEHRVPLDQILVVTFTRAASAELRARIRARLRALLGEYERTLRQGDAAAPEEETAAHLMQVSRSRGSLSSDRHLIELALERFDESAISTIHGFCQRVLQQHSFESGVELDLTLSEDIGPLLQEVIEDYWVDITHDGHALWLEHLEQQQLSLSSLRDLGRRALATPDLTLLPAPAEAAPPAAPSMIAAFVASWNRVSELWGSQGEPALQLLRSALERGELSGRSYREAWLEGAARGMRRGLRAGPSLDPELARCLGYFGREKIDGARPKARRGQSPAAPPRHVLFDEVQTLLGLRAELEHELGRRSLEIKQRLVRTLRERLNRRQLQARVLSFDDLLLGVREALQSPLRGADLRQAVRARFQAALIDEFQDTDGAQWSILLQLFGGGDRWLFLIGDPKQAIYSFRGADLYTYLRARQEARAQHSLTVNRRSDARLVEAVNLLFDERRLATPFLLPQIEYQAASAVCPPSRLSLPARETGTAAPSLRIRLVPRGRARLVRKGWGIEKSWALAHLPDLVAEDASALLSGGARLEESPSTSRALRPRDLAVLVRTHRQARSIQDALRRVGLQAVLHSAESVLRSDQAEQLTRVASAILDPSHARRVRAALATPLLGLPLAELIRLETDEEGWERWLDRFRRWRELWQTHGFYPMVRQLMREERLPARLLALEGGERLLTDLLHLAELLHTTAAEKRLGPTGLYGWLLEERARHATPGESQQLRLEGNEDAVQVVTLHGCKGLEYPVTFCPYLWDGTLLHQAEQRDVCFQTESGPALDLRPKGHPDQHVSLTEAERQRRAENLRLAYVALTRARHQSTIYWGWFSGSDTSALAHLLQPSAQATEGSESDGELATLSDEQMERPLRRLAEGSHGAIEVSWVQSQAAPRPASSASEGALAQAQDLRCLSVERRLETGCWRRSSFTQLSRTREREPGRPDDEANEHDHLEAGRRDLDREDGTPSLESDEGELVALHDFDRGTTAGLLLHSVLQQYDFAAGEQELQSLLRRELPAYGLDPATWADRLEGALGDCLATPLAGPAGAFSLRDVPTRARLSELAFDFPVCGGLATSPPHAPAVTAAALQAVFRRAAQGQAGPMPEDYADQLGALRFAPLRGFMTGSIDLVFRHEHRWFIVDYKSNWLGPSIEHYGAPRLQAAMSRGHYFLQYHIYAVALERYLRLRVPGYSYDPGSSEQDSFGGVYYLFLRGMSARHAGAGVFFDRPPRQVMEDLDHLLTGAPRALP